MSKIIIKTLAGKSFGNRQSTIYEVTDLNEGTELNNINCSLQNTGINYKWLNDLMREPPKALFSLALILQLWFHHS